MPPGVRDPFEPRRDIHPIAENVIAFDNNVANIDSDAKFDALVTLGGGITFCHPALNVERAADRINGA